MNTTKIDTKMLLSTLWVFVLFNLIFRDIHEIPTRDFLEQALTGTINGVVITDELLLLGGIMIELMIMMVLLARVLPYSLNRWTNIIIGALSIGITVMNNTAPDLDDAFFAAIQVAALACLVWFAWRWKKQEATEFNEQRGLA